MKRGKGIYPAPVYECHMADGTVRRLSFWSPAGKPIDIESGRRSADAILLTDWTAPVKWDRSSGYWRGVRPRRKTVAEEAPSLKGYAAWDYRVSGGFVRSGSTEKIYYNLRAEFVMGPPPPSALIDRGAIVKRFVEHPSIGRIEHNPASETVAAPKGKRPSVTALTTAISAALSVLEQNCPNRAHPAITILRQAVDLPRQALETFREAA